MKTTNIFECPPNLLTGLTKLNVNFRMTTTRGCPEGDRKLIAISSGSFHGPTLSGKVVKGNNITLCLRPDTIGKIKYTLLLKTKSGDFLWMFADGFYYANPEVRRKNLLTKKYPKDSSLYYLRLTGRFESNSPNLAYLNRQLFLAIGEISKTKFGQKIFLIN